MAKVLHGSDRAEINVAGVGAQGRLVVGERAIGAQPEGNVGGAARVEPNFERVAQSGLALKLQRVATTAGSHSEGQRCVRN